MEVNLISLPEAKPEAGTQHLDGSFSQLSADVLRRILCHIPDSRSTGSLTGHLPRSLYSTPQHPAQSFSLVSKAWTPVARGVALHHLQLSRISQVRRLLQYLEAHPNLTQHVREIVINISSAGPLSTSIDPRYPPRNRISNHSIEVLEGPLYALVERFTSVVKLDAKFTFNAPPNAWPQFFEPIVLAPFQFISLSKRTPDELEKGDRFYDATNLKTAQLHFLVRAGTYHAGLQLVNRARSRWRSGPLVCMAS
jgi:hypothetical protein